MGADYYYRRDEAIGQLIDALNSPIVGYSTRRVHGYPRLFLRDAWCATCLDDVTAVTF
jgi:hypothetical protein